MGFLQQNSCRSESTDRQQPAGKDPVFLLAGKRELINAENSI
jgi:hypothetical protein